MAITIVRNPAVPNLPLAVGDYQRAYQDQLNSILRLYFNQLNTATDVQNTNTEYLQEEIDALQQQLLADVASLQAQIDALVDEARPQTLIWLSM